MHWASLLFPLLAVPTCQALALHEKRASSVTNATLYAYGTNISGFPVVYASANSELYVAHPNLTVSGLDEITWDIPTLDVATTTTTNATASNGTSVGSIFIDTTNTFDEIMIVSNGTTGFSLYGKQLVYYDGSSIQSEFWARRVSRADRSSVWVIHWNSDNGYRSGAFPVSLKTTAPA